MTDALVPHEDNPEFSDEHAKLLYEMIHVKSEDVCFHWPTQMLMLNILCDMERCEGNYKEFEQSMRYYSNGDFLWERVEPHLDAIKRLACDIN